MNDTLILNKVAPDIRAMAIDDLQNLHRDLAILEADALKLIRDMNEGLQKTERAKATLVKYIELRYRETAQD